ncbi:collagenase [Caldalkalibacillus thermarum]|uniref:peptidase U32 family protein n=1 Tax=Caldalkalibacillus thermarum TaxID=296745 RepID=UPI0019900A70|nr:peptidase U32 family protein [Caldalkalibacillus thermarum]GGK22085.1 collagenase [Caldalkalibacillus thermarum]
MMNKPELLVTAKSVAEAERLIDAGADAIYIGHQYYGLRVAGDFELPQIEEAVRLAHDRQAKVYVAVNALFHNDRLKTLPDYLQSLEQAGVDAIVFGDPAVLMTVWEIGSKLPLHWNTETTSTNYETVRYWAKKGASRAIVARELSLENVLETKRRVDIEIQAQIHGMTCIFHSARKLVQNYLNHIGEEHVSTSPEANLYLKEKKEEETHYPVFEDINGTHIMSNEDICMLEHLPAFIDGQIDSLKIEGMYKTTEYLEQVTRIYRQAIDLYLQDADAFQAEVGGWLDEIKRIQPPERRLGTGFYFKEQIY